MLTIINHFDDYTILLLFVLFLYRYVSIPYSTIGLVKNPHLNTFLSVKCLFFISHYSRCNRKHSSFIRFQYWWHNVARLIICGLYRLLCWNMTGETGAYYSHFWLHGCLLGGVTCLTPVGRADCRQRYGWHRQSPTVIVQPDWSCGLPLLEDDERLSCNQKPACTN